MRLKYTVTRYIKTYFIYLRQFVKLVKDQEVFPVEDPETKESLALNYKYKALLYNNLPLEKTVYRDFYER
jgi:hypothetical protein